MGQRRRRRRRRRRDDCHLAHRSSEEIFSVHWREFFFGPVEDNSMSSNWFHLVRRHYHRRCFPRNGFDGDSLARRDHR